MDLPWRTSLASIDRYEVIQRIVSSLPSHDMKAAIAIEQAAYDSSSSRDEYDTACATPANPNPELASETTAPAHDPDTAAPTTHDAVQIGSYTDCVPIAEGVTSQVFRSGNRALKVITSHRPIAPHSPTREIRILRGLGPSCVALLDVFRDQEQRLVLVFPYMPLTLAHILDSDRPCSGAQIRSIFGDTVRALRDLHAQGVVHRDIKPSAVLLASSTGPAVLSDFGTAWHPEFSAAEEPPAQKVLDIGTGAYRAPEVLFGDTAYGPAVDMWALGAMLAEALRDPPSPLFESRPASEDGNQLGLILSIFKTIGTPTRETWPEAMAFKVAPFELWTVFAARPWGEILTGVDGAWRDAVAAMVRYDGARATAEQASTWECFT